MKINIKNIIGSFMLATMLYSCDTTEDSVYEPVTYVSPSTFTIVEEASLATDNSFVVTYSPTAVGKGYYAVVPTGTAAPTSTEVHSGSGFQQAGSFDVDGSTPIDINIDSDIFGDYTYDVYAIHKSEDNFISETVTKLSVTTPDTANPSFLRDSSSPAFASGDISPFTPLTLQFDEPVFYQGGNLTFSAYDNGSGLGRTVVVNAGTSTISTSGTTITIDTHGTFQQSDFIIVTWDEGTFTDKSGKSVAALTGFDYYFSTRAFSLAETAYLMQGTWDYSTVFYGGLSGYYTTNAAYFLPDVGQIDLTLDPSDPEGLTLLGINIFAPLADYGYPRAPEYLKIKIGEAGELQVLDENQTSGLPFVDGDNNLIDVEWAAWSFFGSYYPGFYDFEAGTINHWLQVVSADDGTAQDDLDYNYSRVGTFAKSNSKTYKSLEKKNKLLEEKKNQSNSNHLDLKIKF
ncbi:hypothetical protein [Polaribacter sp. Asnod1-A03]|uniref:hypothetical protein n=1 Tax=Polaribacter sp. Asnod1-A03 TaxID=3160581 RepID=UPI003862FAFC